MVRYNWTLEFKGFNVFIVLYCMISFMFHRSSESFWNSVMQGPLSGCTTLAKLGQTWT